MDNILYSVVIPIKNEAENLPQLFDEIALAMRILNQDWELIAIDDGSTDRTWEVLRKLQGRYPQVRPLSFERNYGQTSAFDAGFKCARGEYVITLDADGQNDPADIPKLAAQAPQCDLICGLRTKRKDRFSKRLLSKVANAVRSRLLKDGVSDTGCSLKILRRQCLQQIPLFQGMHRFLPALFTMRGFKVLTLPVSHRQRQSGKSNYHFLNRSLGPILDLFVVLWMDRRQLRYRIKKNDGF